MAKIKLLEEVAATQMAVLKQLMTHFKDQKINAQILDLEKKLNEAQGEKKTLICSGCNETKSFPPKLFEIKKSKYFTCPHGDKFCPNCLKKASDEFREKRKEEKKNKPVKKEEKKK